VNKMEARIAWYDEGMAELASMGGEPEETEIRLNNFMRELVLKDLFYLLTFAMRRKDMRRLWLFHRCNEVQANPNDRLDLWAREHYKSTIITFAKTIQDILANPEITVGIFSHTKPIARGFLRQIKYELETNFFLHKLFPDVLYSDPKREAPAMGNAWSEDKGITVKRQGNPKESTVEAHGLVDGQPTSKHFSLLVYDDVVTLESVTSPEMIKKTTNALALSYNLGAQGGSRRFIGTRYHFNDTYKTLLRRKTATPRIYPATDDGKVTGNPVFLSREALEEKYRDMGVYVFGCQMLQDPKSDEAQGFKLEWMRYYETEPRLYELNIYIVVDPANEKKKSSDYSVFWVVGLGADRNYYVLDCVRDRLNLRQRTDTLFDLHSQYEPEDVGYEKFGMQADIEHIEGEMDRRRYRFGITKLTDSTPKPDRIKRLVPTFENGRIFFPRAIYKRNYEGHKENLIKVFLETEYEGFPVVTHDDMLDDLANIHHPDFFPRFPKPRRRDRHVSWEDKLQAKLAREGHASGTSHMAT
jgi:predicted phage terminase large subunit-like protein